MPRFEELAITPDTLNAIAAMGYEEPTPVQAEAIPLQQKGRDVIVQARTGTGKTAAFGVPMVDELRDGQHRGVAALVLTPTRELAIQVAEEIDDLAKASPVKTVTIYGGTGYGKQNQGLNQKGPLVVVATPGRLLDHMQRGSIDLRGVKIAVLDEADRMLDMGFLPDVERILGKMGRDRRTALFSATMPPKIQSVADRFMRDPVPIRIAAGPAATPDMDQFRVDVDKQAKSMALMSLLKREDPGRAVVFTRTKHLAKRLAKNLDRDGYNAVSLQGNMSQGARNRALDTFRDGRARILVATDVASRGLDVPEITHVINYDIPDEPDVYVHRVGRTARMGRSGRAFTFVEPNQKRDLNDLERTAGKTLVEFKLDDVPSPGSYPAQSNGNGNGGGGRGRKKGGYKGGRRGGNKGGRNRGRRGGGHKGGRRY